MTFAEVERLYAATANHSTRQRRLWHSQVALRLARRVPMSFSVPLLQKSDRRHEQQRHSKDALECQLWHTR